MTHFFNPKDVGADIEYAAYPWNIQKHLYYDKGKLLVDKVGKKHLKEQYPTFSLEKRLAEIKKKQKYRLTHPSKK